VYKQSDAGLQIGGTVGPPCDSWAFCLFFDIKRICINCTDMER